MNSNLLIVTCAPRYWEDTSVNGVKDEDGSLIPFRMGDAWTPIIDLGTGTVVDWPNGTVADVHYKVCDECECFLAESVEKKTHTWRGSYVPDAYLCHGDKGYGDYIILKIDGEGRIQNWRAPQFNPSDWRAL